MRNLRPDYGPRWFRYQTDMKTFNEVNGTAPPKISWKMGAVGNHTYTLAILWPRHIYHVLHRHRFLLTDSTLGKWTIWRSSGDLIKDPLRPLNKSKE